LEIPTFDILLDYHALISVCLFENNNLSHQDLMQWKHKIGSILDSNWTK